MDSQHNTEGCHEHPERPVVGALAANPQAALVNVQADHVPR